MKEKHLAESISIKSPCMEDWDEMFGNEKTRFCSHCAFDVNDISLMTEDEAWDLIDESNGNLCVRFDAHPVTNAPIFADRLYQISRQTGVAAGVLGASLAVSTSVYAQKATGNDSTKPQTTVTNVDQAKNSSGKIDEKPSATPTPTPPRKFMGTMAMIRRIMNPLMLAVKEEKVLKVRLMIAKGADVNEIDKSYYSRTALHVAVETNNLKIANMLLNVGANVNVQDYYKLTPLMTVKGNTSGAILRLLVQHGADVNNKNLNGRTALFEAVQYDNFEAVKALLEVGADATIKDDFGNSVLIYARSESIKKILIIYGAEQKEETK